VQQRGWVVLALIRWRKIILSSFQAAQTQLALINEVCAFIDKAPQEAQAPQAFQVFGFQL
jgi:hypothetical protein